MAKCPVAKALFGSLPEDVVSGSNDALSRDVMLEDVVPAGSQEISLSSFLVFSTEQVKEKKLRGRKKTAAPLVDTSVRRCTRSMTKLDGFK